jgi:hypothetical protein
VKGCSHHLAMNLHMSGSTWPKYPGASTTNSGTPTRYAGGPLLLPIFVIASATFECDFSARNFLIVPKLHHNAAVAEIVHLQVINLEGFGRGARI